MSIIDSLIYDRTQADVDRVTTLKQKILTQGLSSLTEAESSEYMAGLKGAYNYTDLNRVGQAVAYIADQMETLPTRIAEYSQQKGASDDVTIVLPYDPEDIDVNVKANWTVSDIPTQAQMETYLNNLVELRAQLSLPSNAPTVPTSMRKLTYQTANDIEYLLYLINTALEALEASLKSQIDRTASAFAYTGIYYCDE